MNAFSRVHLLFSPHFKSVGPAHLFVPSMARCCTLLAIVVLLCLSIHVNAASTRRSSPSTSCKPFHSTFSPSEISPPSLFYNPPFVPVSPPGSYAVGNDGLELFMDKPKSRVKTKGGVNNIVAEGATINSTFAFMCVLILHWMLWHAHSCSEPAGTERSLWK